MKGLPPVFYVPNRAALFALYDGYQKRELIPHHSTDVSHWQAVFVEFGVAVDAISNWDKLSLDLRLVNFALPDPVKINDDGRSELAKKFEKMAISLEKTIGDLSSMSFQPDVIAVTLRDNLQYADNIPSLCNLKNTLFSISSELKEWKQQPRWREAHQRNRRMELALLLSRVFQNHFGESAIPCGGSHARPVDETNNWTKFFQAVAFTFWKERETPDRQAILWEATKPTIVEFEPRVSDNRADSEPPITDS